MASAGEAPSGGVLADRSKIRTSNWTTPAKRLKNGHLTQEGPAMMTARYAVVMFAICALPGAPSVTAQTAGAPTPPHETSFETSFRTSFTNSCLQSARQSAAGRIEEKLLASFCECSLSGTLKELTTIELLKGYLAGSLSPATNAKLGEVVKTCAQQSLPNKSGSR
jgi:hypothetical protein